LADVGIKSLMFCLVAYGNMVGQFWTLPDVIGQAIQVFLSFFVKEMMFFLLVFSTTKH